MKLVTLTQKLAVRALSHNALAENRTGIGMSPSALWEELAPILPARPMAWVPGNLMTLRTSHESI
jgi:hypothetical protein